LTHAGQPVPETLRALYLELVTDENARENLRAKTEHVRNLILSLAFGSLAAQSPDKS
jgi:DNA-dependent RNA polymerase auxiliary subunit epsilon